MISSGDEANVCYGASLKNHLVACSSAYNDEPF